MKQLRFGLIATCAFIAATGCGHAKPKSRPWLWWGATKQNTLWFRQHGTRPRAQMDYREAWEAELFTLPDCENVPLVSASEMALGTADFDGDGQLEIACFPLGYRPGLVLDDHGLPKNCLGARAAALRVVPTESAGVAPKIALLPASLMPGAGEDRLAWTLPVNGRLLGVRNTLPGPTGAIGIAAAGIGTGEDEWSYRIAARSMPWALADVDGDGRDEILVGTYGEEHGVTANGTTDTDSCYCIALSDSGRLVWQRGFGAWPFAGCRLCAADLDGDGRVEVVAACHAWQLDAGGLYVLDGATGAELAGTEGPEQALAQKEGGHGLSFGTVGCADIDSDGRQEIVAAWSGAMTGIAIYRFSRSGGLELVRWRLCGVYGSGAVGRNRLRAICDLDGDRKAELVLTQVRQSLICRDPLFYPAKFDSCELVTMSSKLEDRQRITLPSRAEAVVAADIIPGGNIELLVRSDRLTLYSTDRGE